MAPGLPECSVALLLVDVVNDFDFPEGGQLLARAAPAADRIARLAARARAADVPVIYVNDNFGYWSASFAELVERYTRKDARGRAIVERLRPVDGDLFVLKPMHSGFFRTPLEVLLGDIGARTLVITGFAGNICVFFTAHDAHMRGFDLVVPRDCVASNTEEDDRAALTQLARVCGAETPAGEEIAFDALMASAGGAD